MKKSLITLVLLSGAAMAAEKPFINSGATNNTAKSAPQVAPKAAPQTVPQATPPAAAQPGQGQGEQRQRPDPTQMATQMMSNYDENKDSLLSQDELTKALGEMRKNRPQRSQQSGQQNSAPAGTAQPGQQAPAQGEQNNQRPEPPAADKIAAQMIEKYSASKTGLTAAELTKALEERHSQGGNRGERQPRNDQNTK